MNYLNKREFGIENDKKNINSIELLNNLIYNAKKGDKESLLNTLEKLINKGINLNYRDENGFSVLHYAVDEGNFKICEILIFRAKILHEILFCASINTRRCGDDY